jgi:hypothetical protein
MKAVISALKGATKSDKKAVRGVVGTIAANAKLAPKDQVEAAIGYFLRIIRTTILLCSRPAT